MLDKSFPKLIFPGRVFPSPVWGSVYYLQPWSLIPHHTNTIRQLKSFEPYLLFYPLLPHDLTNQMVWNGHGKVLSLGTKIFPLFLRNVQFQLVLTKKKSHKFLPRFAPNFLFPFPNLVGTEFLPPFLSLRTEFFPGRIFPKVNSPGQNFSLPGIKQTTLLSHSWSSPNEGTTGRPWRQPIECNRFGDRGWFKNY